MKFKGIAASDGIAIAKVFKLVESAINIEKKPGDADVEIKKFSEALEKSKEQIINIREHAKKTLSEEDLKVFDAHIQFTEDPMINGEVEALINIELVNASYAVDSVFKKYIDMFSQMDDAYMKERASDIADVSKRVVSNILGIKLPNITEINYDAIIVAEDLTPSSTAQIDRRFVKGFVTNVGGRTSHSAIMARSIEIPAVLGLKNITSVVQNNDLIIVDGIKGEVIINPTSSEIENYWEKQSEFKNNKKLEKKFFGKPSVTKDGVKVELAANIGSPNDIEGALENDAEAIGLFRSEFLYMNASNWPSEEKQYLEYKSIVEKMSGKKVIFRTLDIGGDKKLAYHTFPHEDNPFLGSRAIRFCLENVDIFKTQLRALIRASKYGNLAIMFPMIATIDEFTKAKGIFDKVHQELRKADKEIPEKINVGMMVEIPATVSLIENFAKYSDFFSIGTNDLMQYTMAADRMNQKVSYLYQPLNPSILNMINMTVKGAKVHNRWVGMCGEMAGDIATLPLLIGMGIDELSMSATSILAVKKSLAEIDAEKAKMLVVDALKSDNVEQVEKLLVEYNNS